MEKTTNTDKLSIIRENQELIIHKKWSRATGGVILGFSIVWTAIAGFMCSGIFSSMFDFGGEASFLVILPLVFGLIPLLFVLIGIALFYGGVAMLSNQTKITVDQHLFQVKSGPIPLMRRQRIAISNIQQIYVHEQIRSNNSGQVSYQLSYIDKHGQSNFLLGKLAAFLPVSMPSFDLLEAQTIEKALESFMGIEDQVVAMEVEKLNKKSLEEDPEASNKEYWSRKEDFKGEKTKYSEKEEYEYAPSEKESEGSSAPISLLGHPDSLIVEESVDGLFILKKWRHPIVLFFLIFTVIWNTVLWGIISFLVPTLLRSWDVSLLLPILFMIPFIGIGIWLAYMSIAVIFNSTRIFVNQDRFSLSHTPLPAGKGIQLDPKDILDIELKQERRSSKNGSYMVYLLTLVDRNGLRHDMNIRNQFIRWSQEEAEFLQSKIKAYLHLD